MDQWLVQRKKEQYYQKAKAEKYRARSAYKLVELQKRFQLIKAGNIVVDLGAAPGSWSQVALEFIGTTGKVIGVDIKTVIGLKDNYEFVRGDIFQESILEKIKKALPRAADVVIADAAPEFSGVRTRDIGIAMLLSFRSLQIAKDVLRPNGKFVSKAFRGADYDKFVAEVKKNFEVVKEFKPKASLSESSEIYVIGLRLKKSKTD
jgi:23S rRNA (uridine2552-2'-O)-methyltransferase